VQGDPLIVSVVQRGSRWHKCAETPPIVPPCLVGRKTGCVITSNQPLASAAGVDMSARSDIPARGGRMSGMFETHRAVRHSPRPPTTRTLP